ncbi:uncharacterized protein HMPREF1541_06336 [Cyphellophora europaea CBS 101466]|uniref:Uncharacterized protein n=1 Tax=Cyphellophora europaea (strain CBS 101466) TaxID=1220924 RepID=W2RPR7_CYPE1|nr:uncharacterized protein HMPREF1541_06336 [Cyphellophora europaea CBS 101466]ETN38305.1 hypothetical protein HMPREF1541_06336 [Cyphellophora europaea CBS 101466]
MTRRKRTPPPSPRPSRAFQIPASLQQLSALSASLARRAEPSGEQRNSEVVRQAQALTGGEPSRDKGHSQQGQESRRQTPKNRGLRWKFEQQGFPEDQKWLPSSQNARSAGHATFLQRRALEAQAGTGSNGAGGRVEAVNAATGAGSTGDSVGVSGSNPQAMSTLKVRLDGRMTVNPEKAVRGVIGVGVGGSGSGDSEPGPSKKRKIEFVELQRRNFSDTQSRVRPTPTKPASKVYDKEVEARRQMIMARLREQGSPAVGEEQRPRSATGLNMIDPALGGQPRRSPDDGSQHNALSLSSDQARIAALIAEKRRINEASGQMQRLLELRKEHQRKLGDGASNGTMAPNASSPAGIVQQSGGPVLAPRFSFSHVPPRPAALPPLPPFPGSVDVLGRAQDPGESDEDAPGEEDTPVERQPAPDHMSTLNTDPGDLRALFSTPILSPRPPLLGRNPGDDAYRERHAVEEGVEPESPSAQLLMALANATPPPQGFYTPIISGASAHRAP